MQVFIIAKLANINIIYYIFLNFSIKLLTIHIQVGTVSLELNTNHSDLVLDLICKDLGYKKHVLHFIVDSFFEIHDQYFENGILSNVTIKCPEEANSLNECNYKISKSIKQEYVGLACVPYPG